MNRELLEQLKQITEEEQKIISGQKKINENLYIGLQPNIVDCKKLLRRGALIEIRTHTRFIHFPEHKHNYVEVIYMCQGQTTHVINGDQVVLKEGELLFLNQNATQEIYPASEEDIAVNFIIVPDFFQKALTMLQKEDNLIREFIVGCLCEDSMGANYLHFQVADVLPIQNLVENLIWSIHYDSKDMNVINQTTMGLLFMQLMNCTDKLKSGEDSFDRDLVLSVLRYIEDNYQSASLQELCLKLNYNNYWLSRTIKKLTGKNFTQLLQQQRLTYASQLLSSTKLSIAQIASMVGYDNISFFHRIFREKFQLSPRQYRIQCKNKDIEIAK